MGVEAKPDFSGYATKAGLKCSDGRTIMPDAFKHQDQEIVPLVWQHNHDDPKNVLGHALLEHRDGHTYAYGFFNQTKEGQNAKMLVEHKDIRYLSIYANQLTEKSKKVLHGIIREVSLVLAGANPGALIDNISLAHSDGEIETLEDEAIIFTGEELIHDDSSEEKTEESEEKEEVDNPSVQQVYDEMSQEQKNVVHTMVGAALDGVIDNDEEDKKDTVDKDKKDDEKDLSHDDKEGRQMGTTHNIFENEDKDVKDGDKHVLTHDAMRGIVDDAKRCGSLREAVEDYVVKHGIENIDVLFPEARNITDTPEFDSRRVEWVAGVLNGTRHSPFSRIKSIVADITFDEARAKGYIKGNMKKEEYFAVSKRITTPATIYKKQKLDRDDIIDITDFDVVMWLKLEMRMMFDEELARAILIGDGRDIDDEDKVQDPIGASQGAGIRSILHDHDLYASTFTVDDSATGIETADAITAAMSFYKGSGNPVFYTTLPELNKMLLMRDEFNRRLWKNASELAMELGVSSIETVEVMETEENLVGIIVNLRDYTIGADKGGEVSFFDFFDIDYNQFKYLYESRLSGALTKIRSAIIIMRAESGGTLATPVKPDFDGSDVVVDDTAHVTYRNGPTDSDDDVSDSTISLAPGESVTVYATPDSGYYFADNIHDQWTFTNRSSS